MPGSCCTVPIPLTFQDCFARVSLLGVKSVCSHFTVKFCSLCIHFDVNYSFWRFWNVASINMRLTSTRKRKVMRQNSLEGVFYLFHSYFKRNHGLENYFFMQYFLILWFSPLFQVQNRLVSWSCPQRRFSNIYFSALVFHEVARNNHPYHLSIALP